MKEIKSAVTAVFTVLVSCLLLMGCIIDDNTDTGKVYARGKVIILQAYGNAGDGSPAGVSHSFVELYNISDEDINLNGISLYYANGTRSTDAIEDEPWKKISLNGTIPAKGSFLILGAKHSNLSSTRYTIADGYGDINDNELSLNRRAFKVALIKGTAELTVQNPFTGKGGKPVSGYIDMVGAANEYQTEDSIFGFETLPARCSASESVRRANLTDTDNNRGESTTFPDADGDFTSIRYAAGNGSITNEELEVRKPQNSSKGNWDPFAEPEPPEATDNTLLILQIGAATDGNVSHSFVELYNNGEQAVELSGYSLQYAEGTRETEAANRPNTNTEDGPWNKIDLSGTIQPKHSYLILGKKGTSASPALLITDDYGDINDSNFEVSNRSFKVVLLSNTTLLTMQNPFDTNGAGTKANGYIDMVGAMNTVGEDKINGYEGNPITDLNKQTGQRRKTLTDTDDNAYDFERAVYSGAASDEVELRRPKNLAHGAWDPITGE